MVEVKNLSVKFDDFIAVDNISFSVKKGEIFGFLGANGAGKTTTIRVLSGLLRPSIGRVRVAGIDIDADIQNIEKNIERVKKSIGYMSQKFTLYDDLSVDENLQFTAGLRKIPKKIFTQRRDELLSLIAFQKKTNTLIRDLPGGI
ncbi:MAG: ABC transporter ATP-binding protein, partial [Oligoflexia bacterium]|nr:ABC transporter ATP-binding protein [Oligoflexia bacterium]